MPSEVSQESVTRPATRGSGKCPKGMLCLLTSKSAPYPPSSFPLPNALLHPSISQTLAMLVTTIPGSALRAHNNRHLAQSPPLAAQLAQCHSEKLRLQWDKGLAQGHADLEDL